MHRSATGIIFVLLLTVISYAQNILDEKQESKIVVLGLNSDAFAGIEAGYARATGDLHHNNFTFYIHLSIPLLLAIKHKSINSWDLKCGINSELLSHHDFQALADFQIYLIYHRQPLGTFIPCGFKLGILPLYKFHSGYSGLQFTWDQSVVTHITHSNYVKDTFADLDDTPGIQSDLSPKNGWFFNTGSHFSAGIKGGGKLNPDISFSADLGIVKFSSPLTGFTDGMMLGQIPFRGNLQLFFKMSSGQ